MNLIDRFGIHLILLGALLLAVVIPTPRALALEPCCGITAIDAKTGLVTAKVNATGKTFQFKVDQLGSVKGLQLLKSLKVGQTVYADFKAHKVSVDGLAPCCGITQVGF